MILVAVAYHQGGAGTEELAAVGSAGIGRCVPGKDEGVDTETAGIVGNEHLAVEREDEAVGEVC